MNPKEDLKLLAEITIITLSILAVGALITGFVITVADLAGTAVGLITMVVCIIATLFVWAKIDEARE